MSADQEDDKTVILPRGQTAASGWAPTAAPATGQVPATSDSAITRPAGATAAVPVGQSDDSAGNPLAPGSYLGEFEIQRVLGEGGFGIVYLAWDHSLERRVALKEYMPSALATRDASRRISLRSERHRETFDAGMRSFINEAKLLAQFDHPSLVKVYRFWEDNGTAYMVMPFYEGPTLKQVLASMPKPVDEAWLKGVLAPLAEALDVLHNQQIYHRDVAPDNVLMLKDSGRPVILDFGAARRVIGDMTQALTVILKTGYAPVEQYAEVPDMRQGPWTDVYALGAVAHFALKGSTPPASVGRMMNDTYKPLAQAMAGQYSEALLSAIDAALQVRPDQRTQSMLAFRQQVMGGAVAASPVMSPASVASGADDLPIPKTAPTTASGEAGAKTVNAQTGQGAGTAPQKSRVPMLVAGAVGGLVLLGGGLYALLSPPAKAPAAAVEPAPATPPPVAQSAPVPPVAPVVPPVAQTAPAAAAFDVGAEFDKAVAASTPGQRLQVNPAQTVLKIDRDMLRFSLNSTLSGYAYVFLKTTDGKLMQLFPNTQTPELKVKAGQTLTVPPKNGDLVAGGPEGTDQFLVIVSESKRQFKATDVKIDSGFGFINPQSPVLLSNMASRSLPVLLGDTTCDPLTCSQSVVAARFELQEVR